MVPGGILLLSLGLSSAPASNSGTPAGSSVTLGWSPSAAQTVAGYDIYYGGISGTYTNQLQVGNVTNATISGLIGGATYYFAATAYNAAGVQSGYTSQVSAVLPVSPSGPGGGSFGAAPARQHISSVAAPRLTLQSTSVAPAPVALQISAAPAGQLVLTVAGPGGGSIDILATQDFQEWTVIGTVTLSDGGLANFTDTNAADFPQRYYRTRVTP